MKLLSREMIQKMIHHINEPHTELFKREIPCPVPVRMGNHVAENLIFHEKAFPENDYTFIQKNSDGF